MTTSTHEEVPRYTLEDHVREYMEAFFPHRDFVTIHASTLGSALDLTGYTCAFYDQHKCGYELLVFENEAMRVVAFCDKMSGKWVICTHLPLDAWDL